jgi:hypothetical protein
VGKAGTAISARKAHLWISGDLGLASFAGTRFVSVLGASGTKTKKPNIIADVEKLTIYNTTTSAPGYVLLFGQSGYLKVVEPNSEQSFKSRGKLVSWEAGRSKYSAQWLRYI